MPITTKIAISAEAEKRLAAMISVLAGIFLTGMKLVVGLLTGSLAILSEAVHSCLDLVTAVITYLAVRISSYPPDEEHRYGHGKVENLSALIECLLLLITCLWIIYEAVTRIFYRFRPVEVNILSFTIMAISVVVNIIISRILYRVARRHSSEALQADALHYSSDIFSSLVVLTGLVFVRLGWPVADAIAALVVALMVIIASLRLARRSFDALLDRAPVGLADKIETAVRGVDGVLEIGRLRLRRSGNKTFVDMNISVERNLPLERSHDITAAIEERVHDLVPGIDVVVHIDPMESSRETMVERIRTIASKRQLTVHNLVLHSKRKGIGLDLHLEVDSHLNLGEAHDLASQLEDDIRAELPSITAIDTHIESRKISIGNGEDITGLSSAIVEQVRQMTLQVPGLRNAHRIIVRRMDGSLAISLHCTFDERLSIEAVHAASSTLEVLLKKSIPQLGRILIHTEPCKP